VKTYLLWDVASCSLIEFLHPEIGGSRFFGNVGAYLPDCRLSRFYSRRIVQFLYFCRYEHDE
jgi:hypothetical protein